MQFHYVAVSEPGFHPDKNELSDTLALNKQSDLTA